MGCMVMDGWTESWGVDGECCSSLSGLLSAMAGEGCGETRSSDGRLFAG